MFLFWKFVGKYVITMDKNSKLCTVKGDDIDPIQIVRKLRMLCHVDIVAVERPKEPEKKEEELEKEIVEVVNASSLAAAVIGPSKEPKKKEEELEKEEPEKKKEELVEVVNASSLAAAIGPSKGPKKKEDQLKNKEPTKQEEKKEGEEIITDVKEDPNKTFRAGEMKVRIIFFSLFSSLSIYFLLEGLYACMEKMSEAIFFFEVD